MSIIFSDDFSSYLVGSTMPQGPWGGSGTVGGTYGPPPVVNQHYVNVGNIYTYTSNLVSGIVYCGFAIGFGAFTPGGTILSINNGDPASIISTTRFINVRLEQDFSLSLLGPNGIMLDPVTTLPSNTGNQVGGGGNPYPYFMFGLPGGIIGGPEWVWFALSWTLSLGSLGTIIASATLSVNSGAGGCAGTIDSGLTPASTPLGVMVCNMYELSGGSFQGGNFANFAACTTGSPLPNPGTPKARCSQIVVELITLPATSSINARMSQAAIELLTLPNSTNVNARASQFVIELLAGFVAPASFAFWMDADIITANTTTSWTDYID